MPSTARLRAVGRGGEKRRCVYVLVYVYVYVHIHDRGRPTGGENLPREQKVTEEFIFGHHYVAVEVPSSLTAYGAAEAGGAPAGGGVTPSAGGGGCAGGGSAKNSRETVSRTPGGAEHGKGTQHKRPDVYMPWEMRLSEGKAARTGPRNGHDCGIPIS